MWKPFFLYCAIVSLLGLAANALFIIVTRLRRVEGFQEVLIFMRNISAGYSLCSVMAVLLAPETRTLGATRVVVVHGLMGHMPVEGSHVLSALASAGMAVYLYTMLCFCVMFLYRYNVTCKTSTMSTVFTQRNAKMFLALAGVFSLIVAVLRYYSKVDTGYLLERLNHSTSEGNKTTEQQAIGTTISQAPQTMTHHQPQLSPHMQQQQHSGNGTSFMAAMEATSVESLAANSSSMQSLNVYGTDYTRNPMLFLSMGIYAATLVICSLVIVIASLVVSCKLRGKQESMSDKLQSEHQKLIRLLIIDAYLPVLLTAIAGTNFALSVLQSTLHLSFEPLRHSNSFAFQGYLTMLVMLPLSLLFPLANIFLVRELRECTFQLLLFRICTPQQRKRLEQQAQQRGEAEAEAAATNGVGGGGGGQNGGGGSLARSIADTQSRRREESNSRLSDA